MQAVLPDERQRELGVDVIVPDKCLNRDLEALRQLEKDSVAAGGWADVVFGSRFYGKPHRALYFHHYMGNRLISWLVSWLCDITLDDIEVCYKMFRREVLDSLTSRIGLIKQGIQDSPKANPKLRQEALEIEAKLREIDIALRGDKSGLLVSRQRRRRYQFPRCAPLAARQGTNSTHSRSDCWEAS